MQDNRLTVRLTNYWQNLRKDLPPIERFNPEMLGDVMAQCCVWRVEIAGKNTKNHLYTCEFIGDDVKKAIGADLTGEIVSPRFPDFPAARILEKIDSVVEKAAIETDDGQFINERNEIVKYRSCLLPFGTKTGQVTNVVLGMSWTIY